MVNKCPECLGEAITTCRCMRGDSECANGHHWHWCVPHHVQVSGHSDHSIPTMKCTCGKGDDTPEPTSKYEKYIHHGNAVSVRTDLKGKHREYCLCFQCSKFSTDRAKNCTKANLLYALDVELKMTTPVWECPDFAEE